MDPNILTFLAINFALSMNMCDFIIEIAQSCVVKPNDIIIKDIFI